MYPSHVGSSPKAPTEPKACITCLNKDEKVIHLAKCLSCRIFRMEKTKFRSLLKSHTLTSGILAYLLASNFGGLRLSILRDQDQWVQCDDCIKWRRLPVDVLVPSNWTCAANTWDPKRSSCSAPDELTSTEIQNLLQQNAEIKRQRTSTSSNHNPKEVEVSGLDALATAAALGDSMNQATTSSSATTTKHPRHRPGCTCIVCIQPPSGKGPKHHPNCMCNVCMTVKRRFKTLMMRKKKRQSEREEAEANKILEGNEVGTELTRDIVDNIDMGKGHIDLNFQPEHDSKQNEPRVSMMSLVHVASLPLENYLKQNGLTSLACEQQVSSSSATVPQSTPIDDSEERTPDEGGSGDNVRSDTS